VTEPFDRFDPDVRALLERERDASLSPPDRVRARIRSAVLAAPSGGGGSGGDPGGGGASHPGTIASSSLAPSTSAGWSTGAVLGALSGTLLLGAVLGASLHAAWIERSAAEPASAEPARPALATPAPHGPSAHASGAATSAPIDEGLAADAPVLASADDTPADVAPRVAETPPAPPTRAGADTARREIAAPAPTAAPPSDNESTLIDEARIALRRDRPHDALVALMQHEREHPDGLLAEERDRLIIEGLIARGRIEPARRRARAFLAAHPESAHRDAIARMLAGD
jgi:hypothetical protein